MDWSLPVCGFVVGGLVGVTGMGGGSVMTAVLILVFGVPPMTAVGTDLLYAAATKATGARVHAGNGNVVWPLVGMLAIGSVPATILTIWLLSHFPVQSPLLARGITLALGAAVMLAGLGLLFQERVQHFAVGPVDMRHPAPTRPVLTVTIGLLLGVLVSLTSVGAGALGIVMLRYLRPDMPSVRLVGSDIAHAVPLTLLAGTGHWMMGDVDWVLLGSLLLGSIPGIVLSSHYAHHLSERILRPVLGLELLAIGLNLIWT